MNIIKRYLEYRKNGKAVRHDEYVLPEPLFIGSPSLEDISRTFPDGKVLRTHSPLTNPEHESVSRNDGDTLTPQDYRGEDAEAIKAALEYNNSRAVYERFRQ